MRGGGRVRGGGRDEGSRERQQGMRMGAYVCVRVGDQGGWGGVARVPTVWDAQAVAWRRIQLGPKSGGLVSRTSTAKAFLLGAQQAASCCTSDASASIS